MTVAWDRLPRVTILKNIFSTFLHSFLTAYIAYSVKQDQLRSFPIYFMQKPTEIAAYTVCAILVTCTRPPYP